MMTVHKHPHEKDPDCHCTPCRPLERPCGCDECLALEKKPPTQIAGVEGIAPKPIELTPSRPSIDWSRLFSLPPFQMYAIEKSRLAADSVEKWLPGWAQEHGAQDLFDDYCLWHAAKGYWPDETPMGELRVHA